MYGSGQIIHAIPFNKPFDLGKLNEGTSFAWGLPPFANTHYEFVDGTKKTKWGAHEIWSGPSKRNNTWSDTKNATEVAAELLESNVIRPAVSEHIGTSHYECCGQWKTNDHMWWCENGPRYDRVTPESSKKLQLATLEELVLSRKALRSWGFKWEIPSHLRWLLEG